MTSTADLLTVRRWEGGRPMVDDGGRNRPWLWRPFLWLLAGSVAVPLLVIGVLVGSLVYVPLSATLPPARPGIDARVTHIFDASGTEIASLHGFDTTLPVTRAEIPRVVKQAVVAAEDRRFYRHRGVDGRSILRAFNTDVGSGGYAQGASTITQQYVRLAYTGNRRTLGRKLREAILAGRVERTLSKDEILYRYLSRVYFGAGAYGVGAAADSYFRKPVRDLTVSEAALLAAIIRAPTRYDPRKNPSGAEAQRQFLLDSMLNQRRIKPEEYSAALAAHLVLVDDAHPHHGPATLVYPPRPQQSTYPYFTEYVRSYLVAKYGDAKVYKGGLRVETSLDPGLQARAEAAVAEGLRDTAPPLEMALVTVDAQKGLVRALVGGRDFARSQVNLALAACPVKAKPDPQGPVCVPGGGSGRQPGSAFKPFTLAKALESGMDLDRVYRAPSVYTYPHCTGNGCTVHNVEGGGGGSLTIRDATVHSVNTVFAQLVRDVGVKDTAELAHRLGLTTISPDGKLPSGEPYGPSLTLGAAEVAPLDMAAAYGVLAARGMQAPVSPVARVLGPQGQVLEDNNTRKPRSVLRQDVADRVTGVLQDVIAHGTGRQADLGRPYGTAGKTGTAEDYSDAWFVGYTPALSTAVWMGYSDSKRPLVDIRGVPRVFGGTIPAQTWRDFMTHAEEIVPASDFTCSQLSPEVVASLTPKTTTTTTSSTTTTSTTATTLFSDDPAALSVPVTPPTTAPTTIPTSTTVPLPPPPPPMPACRPG